MSLEDIYREGIPSFEIIDQEWAEELQRGLEQYMMSLYDAIYEGEEGYTEEDSPADNTESGISFCGCHVCEGREMLAYATPRIIKGYLERKINIHYGPTEE